MDRRKLRVLLRHRSAMAGLVVLTIFLMLAGTIDLISTPEALKFGGAETEQNPSAEHWFGTDNSGRDIFTRIWVGIPPKSCWL